MIKKYQAEQAWLNFWWLTLWNSGIVDLNCLWPSYRKQIKKREDQKGEHDFI